ncbi:nucleotidyltransferase domain-containing protein [Arthrobacter pigmenti]
MGVNRAEALELAGTFVAEHFPAATTAVLSGSAARGEMTATSDVDMLLILPEGGFAGDADSLAANYGFRGYAFEVFAYTREAFWRWVQSDAESGRPTLADMCVSAIPVRTGPEWPEFLNDCRTLLDAGPRLAQHQLDLLRYQLTDAVDDLADCPNGIERQVLAGVVYQHAAGLALLGNNHWVGDSKWLPRRLNNFDTSLASRLGAALVRASHEGMTGDLVALSHKIMADHGGRLREGFVR